MRSKSKAVLPCEQRKQPGLTPISIRLPAELWQKCGWAAAAVGMDRSTYVRNALTQVAQDAKPPANAQSREILASDEEWRAWDGLAGTCKTTIDYLIRRALNGYVETVRRKTEASKRKAS